MTDQNDLFARRQCLTFERLKGTKTFCDQEAMFLDHSGIPATSRVTYMRDHPFKGVYYLTF